MKFTKEQVLSFSTNWKQFHASGLHKAKPVVIESGLKPDNRYYFAPQTHMRSDMSFLYYVLYNYLRNLPLERGVSMTKSFPTNLNDLKLEHELDVIYRTEQRIQCAVGPSTIERLNTQRATILSKFTNMFGEGITEDILLQFRAELTAYTYKQQE